MQEWLHRPHLTNSTERILRRTLELAREAVRAGSSPISCVIVDAAGKVLSEGYNRSSLP